MSEQPGDESGVFPVIEQISRINPDTTPYMPEITRMAFRKVTMQMERLRRFFADIFYFQPERNLRTVNLVDKVQQALFNDGIRDDDCFVGHVRSPAEGVDDELVLSTPRALVLFDCEPQAITRPHPAPRHTAIKFVDPTEGLYMQPHGGLFTLNFGGLRFHEHGVYEKRHLGMPLNALEAKLWDEHVARWGIKSAESSPEDIQKSSFASILDLLHFKRRTGKMRPDIATPVFVSYPEFQRRLQNILSTTAAGLNAINGFIDEQSPDGPLHPDGFERY